MEVAEVSVEVVEVVIEGSVEAVVDGVIEAEADVVLTEVAEVFEEIGDFLRQIARLCHCPVCLWLHLLSGHY